MEIPEGVDENHAVEVIMRIAKRLAPKYVFASYDVEDIEQEAFLIGIAGLEKYDQNRPLENFMYTHISNRLKTFKRDNYYRFDYGNAQKIQERKKSILEPMDIAALYSVSTEDETISNAHITEMLDLIDRKLPSELRGDYLRLQTNSSLPKGRKAIVIQAIEDIINGDYDESTVELHFGSSAPGGYAWVFPKKNGANIGLGIQKKYSKGKNLRFFAEKFYSKYEGEIIYQGSGALPMSGSLKTMVKNNKLIVGDAAGMVLPSNGAGISTSMIGARIAGQVVAEHILNDVPLTEYERIWNIQMGKIMRNSKRSLAIGSLLFRSPDFLVNLAFNRLTKRLLWRAVTCRAKFGIL